MPQIFPEAANGIARLVLWAALVAVLGLVALSVLLPRSDMFTGQDRILAQPVPFSHQHHAGGLGIDCRYCHAAVEQSAFAGMPPTETCMTCHSQLWTRAEMLDPVRQSLATGTPLRWNRVHDLADYVYFNHGAHVSNGVGCTTCHGAVDEMPLMRQAAPLTMEWCLDCHRDPAPNLRPPEAVFATDWRRGSEAEQAALMGRYDIHPETMTDCNVCHR
ncbi:cytochrome c3 family protein [Psychromarinibacter sp. C21-152]|uniref:Cytochrome c3 family protein n=1 Tax=Psychromarinibacter sediminicola TaxID=3033385 RepID=A0AAE3NR61_9RHOB|nr:cytochrome c3 family protein [Psychromarinibacter sediminicola]MDF0602763.1 cytochrome c3 family protein [Psychromarinibacter sediminicola]